jgi:Carboxypeptidase regulatory-like domain
MHRILCILLALTFTSGSAWASTSSFQGIVKDPKGHLIPGAIIRVEKDGKIVSKAKTDADGHYVSAPLSPGVYTVDLIIDSAMIAALTNAKTKAAGSTELNFNLQDKRYWVRDTGSNIKREVDPNDPSSLAPNYQLYKTGRDYLQRMQDRTAGAMR